MAPGRQEFGRRWIAAVALSAIVVGSCSSAPDRDVDGAPVVGADDTGTAPAATVPVDTDCRGTAATEQRDVAYRTVEGVDPNLLSLDLYLPARPDGCGPAPIVVYVHGGGFRVGDKANRIADKVRLFTEEGWALASVNYRLSPDPPDDRPDAVRYPTHEHDVAAAIAWLVEHAAEHGIDAERFLLLGHSSGAYLVSLLGTDTSLLDGAGVDPSRIRCVASLDTEYDAEAQVAQGGSQEVLYRNALGNDPAVWADASPINHVADPGPHPVFLIVTQGPPRRTNGSQAFADALVAQGNAATVVNASPLSHEEINAVVGAPGDAVVTPPLVDLFRACTAER